MNTWQYLHVMKSKVQTHGFWMYRSGTKETPLALACTTFASNQPNFGHSWVMRDRDRGWASLPGGRHKHSERTEAASILALNIALHTEVQRL